MYLCFDIGGTNIKAGLFSDEGSLIEKVSSKTPADYDNIVMSIKDIAFKYPDVKACAIAVPGTCMPEAGQILFCPNLLTLNGKNLKNDVQKLIKKPVYLENDANMAALGEYYFYEKNNIKNMIFLTLGTGLGGGAILNGELLTSDISMFEAGHINIDPEGRQCGCGKKGCLETYVNVSGLLRTYNTMSASEEKLDSANKVYNLYKSGDRVAALAYEVLGGYLAIGMATLANILVPQKIKIGGGLSEMADAFLPNTYKVFSKHVYPAYRDRVSIELSSLRNNAGLSGCAAMCISKK